MLQYPLINYLTTAQSKSSENSFEEQNDEAREFEAKFEAKFANMEEEFSDEIEYNDYESYLNPCSHRGYTDDFYQRQPQRLLSTSSSEKFLKIPEKFVKSRSFSTSSKAKRISKRDSLLKVKGWLLQLQIQALKVTECGYKNSSSKFIMAKPLK